MRDEGVGNVVRRSPQLSPEYYTAEPQNQLPACRCRRLVLYNVVSQKLSTEPFFFFLVNHGRFSV